MNNNNSQKILEISSYPPPRAGWGVRVSFLKKALIQSGHECKVLNTSPYSRKIPSPEYMTVMSGFDYVRKVLVHRLKGFKVHMHMNGDSPKGFVLTLLAELISFFTFKRPILTFHAGPYQKYFPQERAPLLTPMYKLIFSIPSKIICNNNEVKEKIMSYGINPAKIFPIQAFSIQYLEYDPVPLNGELQDFIANRKPLISTYVFPRPEFFIEQMLKAISHLIALHPNLGLVMLGGEQDSDSIRAEIERLGIQKNVFLAGDQAHDAFLTLLSKSDIYLRTPVKDGVCSSVLEALSLGIPVVASENKRRPESVITYNNDDINDMVKVIDSVITNLSDVKRQVIKPHIRDTVKDELELLLN